MRIVLVLALVVGCGSASPPSAAPPGPPLLEIPAQALPPHGTLMLGDWHGTREIPAFVGQLVAATAAREPVVLALEIPADVGPAIAAYLASDGRPARRQALIAGAWWREAYQDGRRSVAMAELIETARALRAAGVAVDIVAFDEASTDSEAREAAMARNLIAARRARPDAAMIVYAGNLHVSKAEVPFRPGHQWTAMRVAAAGIPLVSLNARWTAGTAWICPDADASHCGASATRGASAAPPGIHLEPSPDGKYDGWFGVGAISASPPVAFSALAGAAASPR
ncbi:MAG TPA: hypothetical protein VK601_07275 [Kofleriaceae bacterium]|nr:hypothetical protein [Kofleriaceae bacterium]